MTNSAKKAIRNGGGPSISSKTVMIPPTTKGPSTQLALVSKNGKETEKALESLSVFQRMTKEDKKQMVDQIWFQRSLIVCGKHQKKNENQTMKWIREVTKRNNLVGLDEIRYCFKELASGEELDYETPWMLLQLDDNPEVMKTILQHLGSVITDDMPETAVAKVTPQEDSTTEYIANLYEKLMSLDEKIVEELEFSHYEVRPEVLIRAKIGGRRYVVANANLESMLVDFLTFLELCYEHNATIQMLTVAFRKADAFRDFLPKFLGYEIVGKINVEMVFAVGNGVLVKDCLPLAKYIKCKALKMMWCRFEFEDSRELVEAMRECHPGLEECEITTVEEIPEYCKFWKQFDQFDVSCESKYMLLQKSDQKMITNGNENLMITLPDV